MIELLASLGAMVVLLMGLTSAIVVASRGIDDGRQAPARMATAAEVAGQLTAELQLALSVPARTPSSITFTVADRTGDNLPETIDYAWTGAPEFKVLRAVNGGDPVVLAEDVQDFALSYETRSLPAAPPTPPAEPPPSVLVVVEDPDNLSSSEMLLRSWFFDWGYFPAVIASWAPTSELDDALATAVAVYVCSGVSTEAFAHRLNDAPVGVVIANEAVVDELAMASGYGEKKVKSIAVVDPDHEITTGIGTGPTISTDDITGVALRDDHDLAPGLTVLATTPGDTGVRLLTAIEQGGLLNDGTIAAGRRVHLPWSTVAFDLTKLNGTGRTILQQAVIWAVGNDTAGSPVGGAGEAVFGYDTEFANANSGVKWTQIATRVELTEPGTLTSLAAFVGGSAYLRLAAYGDEGGEPGTLIVQSNSTSFAGPGWHVISVEPTELAAGHYWLALAFKLNTQSYYFDAGGATRYRNHNANGNGFLSKWGASDLSFDVTMSMYGVYEPGGGS